MCVRAHGHTHVHRRASEERDWLCFSQPDPGVPEVMRGERTWNEDAAEALVAIWYTKAGNDLKDFSKVT